MARRAAGGALDFSGLKRGRPLNLAKELADRAIVVMGGRRNVLARGSIPVVFVRRTAGGLQVSVTTGRAMKLVTDQRMPAGAEQGDAAE